jgi:serine/threonine-protein kinase
MAIDGRPMASWLPPEIGEDPAFTEKYALEGELGIGGSGIVVGARHRELDERVAIKFLLPGGSQNAEAVARFRREARAAARIRSEHVVRIRDISTLDNGIPYIVMEYLEGVDLERMLQQSPKGQLPIHDAIEFVLQACEALAECHCQGIVHRDLKPSNLFCVHGADGLPLIKVLDFGISKLSSATIDTDMTDQTRILGSPRYMSPEQFDSSADVDARTDIWSLGVILYELLSGHAPFDNTHVLELWQSIKNDRPAPLESQRPDLPVGLGSVVFKCLEKDRAKRPSSIADLAKALAPFAPQRARSSIVRIIRTIERPGVATGAIDIPSQQADRMSEAPAVEPPKASKSPGPTATVPMAIAVPLAIGLAASAFFVFRPDPAGHTSAPGIPTQDRASERANPAEPARAPTELPPPIREPATGAVVDHDGSVVPVAAAPAEASHRREPPARKATPSKAVPSANLAAVSQHPAEAESAGPTPVATGGATFNPPWIVDPVEHRKSSK